MSDKFEYKRLKIGNEEFNYLLNDIDKILLPEGEINYTTIVFKSGEVWFTTAPVLICLNPIRKEVEKNEG
jgi:hypothetical protein